MSTEDEKLLKEAKKLPWEDRLLHRNWKVRSDANIDLAALFESITDPKDPRIRELGHFFKKTVADSNEQVQDKALDALIAYLKAADANAARYAKDVCDAVVAKCLTGQMKTVEKAQMVFMLWVELEAVDVFLDAMEKAIKHEVAKAVVPAIDVMFQALSEFGSKIVPPKRILKMLPELFDHQDQNVRASCKGLMLELCRWIGRDPVKSVLFEKMRDEMKKELEAELDNVSGGAAAKPSRKIRSEQDKEPEQKAEEATAEIPHEIDELVDPVDILTPLEKSGFWNGVKPTKPKEARPKLTNLASTKRDFSEICPTLNKEMVCKICLLDNRSYEISCNDATTVSDAVQEVARLVKLSTHSGFGVFKDENVCFCGNANYIPLHENKKLIDVLAELNVKDKLIFKIKVFRDEAITDPVFLYMSFVQLKHDYICGNYSCLSQGDVEQLSSLLIFAQYGADAKSQESDYKIFDRSTPQYLNRKYRQNFLSTNIRKYYLSLEKMNKEDAVHLFVSILSKLPYGKSIFYNTKIIGDNTKIIDTKHKQVIVGVNKVGVHLFGSIQHRELLHSIEMKDIQFGSSKTRFILKTRDYMLEFETKLAEEMCLILKTLTGTKAIPNANINLDSRDEAFKQREDEVKEVGILSGELQQVREDHERQLQQVREDHERQLQQVREDHERQLLGLTSELARFKEDVGCTYDEVVKLIEKSRALEHTCSSQSRQISVLEHQLKMADSEIRTKYEDQKRIVADLQDRLCEAENQLLEGDKLRKKLHNTIMELKGNIKVFLRVRPLLPDDGPGAEPTVSYPTSLELAGRGIDLIENGQKHPFTFDMVFTHDATQQEIFMEISPLVQSALDGYKVCIFAYGETGSGKTYTMLGGPEAPGLIPRSLEQVFQTKALAAAQGWRYKMQASVLEIYNEKIQDLLASKSNAGKGQHQYKISHDTEGNTTVADLTIVDVSTKEQVENLLEEAAHSRSVGRTDMNEASSRSHFVFTLRIYGVNESTEQQVQGVLNLIDLAGSERLSKSKAIGERLKETQAINKSLSSLSEVISALAKKDNHVPYRNSKLTYLLQPCLSGDSKTLMFVNMSPDPSSIGESLCSLRFAARVKSLDIGIPRRQIV